MVQKKMKMAEAQLMNMILDELLLKNVFCWRTNNIPVFDATKGIYRRMPKFSMPGLPDISGILPGGRALYIEVKLPGGYPTEAQRQFMIRASNAGACTAFARNMADVYAALKRRGFDIEFKALEKYTDSMGMPW